MSLDSQVINTWASLNRSFTFGTPNRVTNGTIYREILSNLKKLHTTLKNMTRGFKIASKIEFLVIKIMEEIGDNPELEDADNPELEDATRMNEIRNRAKTNFKDLFSGGYDFSEAVAVKLAPRGGMRYRSRKMKKHKKSKSHKKIKRTKRRRY